MATRFTTRGHSLPPYGLPQARNLSRRMTWHIAAGLVVYAVIQFWLVQSALAEGAPRILPWFAVALMLLAIIPAARRIEHRWSNFAGDTLPSRELCQSYRREAARLWSAAIALPFLWVGAFVGATAAAGVLN